MTTDINNFIYFVRKKNKKTTIKHNVTNEKNIYEWLHDFGFRKTKIDNKRIYYRRHGNELTLINPTKIRRAFLDFLRQGLHTNLPDDVNHVDLMNWFYSDFPIKEDGHHKHCSEDTLSQSEIHSLRLQKNPDYKHNSDVNRLIAKLQELNFSKTVDNTDFYSSNAPLYYKNIGNGKYFVLNHWNYNTKNQDGFDGWLATYGNEKQIGKEKPLSIQELKINFLLEENFPIIEQHLMF